MEKHLKIKAFVLLSVMFFYSFVLVPRAHATIASGEAKVIRGLFRAASPTQILANGGKAALIGWRLAGGVGIAYMLYEAGAFDAIINWFNGSGGPGYNAGYQLNTDLGLISGGPYNGKHAWATVYYGSWYQVNVGNTYPNATGTISQYGTYDPYGGYNDASNAYLQWIMGMIYGHPAPAPVPPSVPTDYESVLPGTGSVSIPSNSVSMTPGAFGAFSGGEPVVSVALGLSTAEAARLKEILGLTNVNPATGSQDSSPLDNTANSIDTKSITGKLDVIAGHTSWLEMIKTYAYELLGIHTDTSAISSKMDNAVTAIGLQTQAVQGMAGKLDNIAILAEAQKVSTDCVASSVADINKVSATPESVSTRISDLKTLMATKFPFSFIAGIAAPVGGGGGHYDIPDLQFTGGYTLVVDPMKYPVFADFFGTVRTLVSIGMWAVFTLVMIRRVTQI